MKFRGRERYPLKPPQLLHSNSLADMASSLRRTREINAGYHSRTGHQCGIWRDAGMDVAAAVAVSTLLVAGFRHL